MKPPPIRKRDSKRESSDWRSWIGVRLRILRQASRLTQAQLAELIGADINTISNIERGASAPDYATVEALADAFELKSVDVVTGRKDLQTALADGDIPDPLATALRAQLKQTGITTALLGSQELQGLSAEYEQRLAALEEMFRELQREIREKRK
jgi:transcriptional regulator with XRE-family HTH domain